MTLWIIGLLAVLMAVGALYYYRGSKDTNMVLTASALLIAGVIGGAAIDPSEIPTAETYKYQCDLTTKINDTIIGYNVRNVTINISSSVCEPNKDNGTVQCHREIIPSQKEVRTPILDGSQYTICEEHKRNKITIGRERYRESNIGLGGKTSSVKNDVLTMKDLNQGGTWGDALPDSCWHPNIPCTQVNARTGEPILTVAGGTK